MLNKLFGGKSGGSEETGKKEVNAPIQPVKPLAPKKPEEREAGAGLRQPSVPVKPVQQAAGGQSQAQQKVAAPHSQQKEDASSLDFRSILDEAAIIFASGEEKPATQMLVDYLSKTQGKADQRVWYMLLDLYQAVGDRPAFEQLAMLFAKMFATSPPSWDEEATTKKESVQKESQKLGKNVLLLEGGINGALAAKVKEFVTSARESKTCKVDVSRVRPDACDPLGLEALMQIMIQLRKHKVLATLLGEGRLSQFLEQKVEESKKSPDLKDSIYWLLLLEMLQWRGLMEKFEDLSLDYAITYEVSGPGWEDGGVMNVEDVAASDLPELGEEDEHHEGAIEPDETLTEASIQRLQEMMAQSITEKGEVVIDCRKVKRLDFQSAGALLGYVVQVEDSSRKIKFLNPSEPILALLDVVGVSQYLTIVKRKR